MQRLQRVLAAAGFGSRRSCEELITTGRVEVDGEIVIELGTQVDAEKSKIFVDGVRLRRQRPAYYLLNKPVGVVTTNRDPQGRPRVIDLIPGEERVFPVGRLDRSSEGLILLTNDGELAQQLTHPRFGVRKIYHVTVAGQITRETMNKMREGIYIAEGRVRVEGARIRKARPRATDLEITLLEGKNREIRRILARFGHKVQRLRRIAIGPLRLGELPVGAHRPLTTAEIEKLRNEMSAARKRAKPEQSDASGPESTSRRSRSSAAKRARSSKGARKPTSSRKPASSGATVKPPKSQRRRRETFDLSNSAPPTGAVIGAEPSETNQTPPKKRKAPRTAEQTGKGNTRRGQTFGRSRDEKSGKRRGSQNRHGGGKGKPRRKDR